METKNGQSYLVCETDYTSTLQPLEVVEGYREEGQTLTTFYLFLENMKGKKNDYSMTFYNEEERAMFMEYVHDTDKAIHWMVSKNIQWTHAMVYDRRTRQKITRLINSRNK